MKLPKRLAPNPLVLSTVEIRFTSTLSEGDVLSTFYPAFSAKYPKIRDNRVPKDLRNRIVNLKYSADYTLYNDQFSVSISNNLIAFENVNDYQLWDKYFPFIVDSLKCLEQLRIITSINRVGVRYASIFEQAKDFSDVINTNITFPYTDFQPKLRLYHADYKKDDILIQVRISEQAKVEKEGQKPKSGIYFDLDAAMNKELPQAIDEKLFSIIDSLHSEEKKMFFSLLKPDFIKSLNPEY